MRPGATHFASGSADIESELGWAKKQLDLRQKYADAKRADATHTASADLPKNRIFEVLGPDGRVLRHRAHSVDQLRAELKPGFVPITEVFGFKSDGTGGIAAALDTSVPSITAGLLEAHGGEPGSGQNSSERRSAFALAMSAW